MYMFILLIYIYIYRYQHVGPWYIIACPYAAEPFASPHRDRYVYIYWYSVYLLYWYIIACPYAAEPFDVC